MKTIYGKNKSTVMKYMQNQEKKVKQSEQKCFPLTTLAKTKIYPVIRNIVNYP